MIEWHDAVCEQARIPGTDLYVCFHCNEQFPRDEVCGDHYPHTRGVRPDLKLDPANGVCSCQACNTSGNPNRKASYRAIRTNG